MPPVYVPTPRAPTPDLKTRLLDLLGAEDAEDPTNDPQFIDQSGIKYSAVHSEDNLRHTTAIAPMAYRNHGFQLPTTPQSHGMAPPLKLPQSGGYSNVSTQQSYQELLLGGYTSQELTHMKALLAASVPYRKVFQGQHPLQWAMLAHALDRAAPPREAFAYFSTVWCPFWLPCQADFNNWSAEDATILEAVCVDCNIWLDWFLLDQFGVQAQLVPGPPPPSAPYGSQHTQAAAHGPRTPSLNHSFPPIESSPQTYDEFRELFMPQEANHIVSASEVSRPNGSMRLSKSVSPPVGTQSEKEASQLSSAASSHQPGIETNLPSSVQDASPGQGDGGAAAAAQFRGAPASTAAPFLQSQQSLPAPTSSTSQTATSSKKGKVKRFVFGAEQILQPSKNVKTTIELSTAAERAACTPDTSWYKPENPEEVRKVPQSDSELLPSVLAMKKSMMDTSQAKDKKDQRSSYAKRWSPEALNKKWPVPPKEMEAICWIIAKMVRKYHLEGPAFLHLFDELHQEKANKNQDLTFEQRIQAICTVLLSSKARVDKCLKHEGLGSLVAFPLSVLGISLQNREFNDKRKDLIKAGNRLKKAEADAAASATLADQIAPADVGQAISQDEVGQEVHAEVSDEQAGKSRETEDEEEEDEDEEGEDADKDAEGDEDEGDDEDGKDNENDGDDTNNSTGFSQPDASHDKKGNRDNGYQSRPQSESKTGTKSSKFLSASGHSKQARTGLPAAPGASTGSSTQVPSKPTIRGDTAGRFLQIRALAATADTSLHALAAPVGYSRKRPVTEHLGLELQSSPKRSRNGLCTYSSDGALYGGPGTITPALASPTKRRATEVGMEDTNTCEKSPQSLDRKIIAHKRRPAPS
ncbi:hypothetical protein N0V86_009579 [Didymella sp. IMI 355093]|nr:hypothetical protein N0V86_009579 [Didymella sp. IMI 355093]